MNSAIYSDEKSGLNFAILGKLLISLIVYSLPYNSIFCVLVLNLKSEIFSKYLIVVSFKSLRFDGIFFGIESKLRFLKFEVFKNFNSVNDK